MVREVNRVIVLKKFHHSREVRRVGHFALLPRLLLQDRWQARMLSMVDEPPWLRGTTWSAVHDIG